jgi:hypothetical protein
VTVTATDDRDPAPRREVRVTGPGYDGAWAPLTGTLALDGDGVRTVEHRAVDADGNVSDPGTLTVRIDGTAPVSRATVDTTGRTVTLTAADGLSGLARLEYSLDGATSWQPYLAPVAVGADAATVTYRSVDTAGNVETANRAAVPTSLAASRITARVTPARVTYGTTAKVAVTVSGSIPRTAPTGTVRVLAGTDEVGRGTLSRGAATVTLDRTLPVGRDTLTVLYSGDGRYAAATTTVTLTVVKVASDTDLSVRPTTVRTGRTVTATVTVRTAHRAPADGTVTVRVTGAGWDTTYPGQLDAEGRVTVVLGPFTRKGTVTICASYAGSDTVAASADRGVRVTVVRG